MVNSKKRDITPINSCPISSSYPLGVAFLQQGSIGAEVSNLQDSLQQRGFDPGAIDGSFGVRTHTAVYRFQSSQELSLTGSVDLETWLALGNSS
ncbi:peptidoglycan-binding domain-containing protein [Phormidesmis sp. 146-33]